MANILSRDSSLEDQQRKQKTQAESLENKMLSKSQSGNIFYKGNINSNMITKENTYSENPLRSVSTKHSRGFKKTPTSFGNRARSRSAIHRQDRRNESLKSYGDIYSQQFMVSEQNERMPIISKGSLGDSKPSSPLKQARVSEKLAKTGNLSQLLKGLLLESKS